MHRNFYESNPIENRSATKWESKSKFKHEHFFISRGTFRLNPNISTFHQELNVCKGISRIKELLLRGRQRGISLVGVADIMIATSKEVVS